VSVKYHYGKESFSLTKAGKLWICSDAGVQVDPQRVDETLQGLANLKAERFVAEKPTDLEPFGLKEPMLTIEVQTFKRKLELQLSKMDVDTGKYHARAGSGAAAADVFLISFQDSMRLVRHAEDFAKLPPPVPPGGER
jgi:hypothetical protein